MNTLALDSPARAAGQVVDGGQAAAERHGKHLNTSHASPVNGNQREAEVASPRDEDHRPQDRNRGG